MSGVYFLGICKETSKRACSGVYFVSRRSSWIRKMFELAWSIRHITVLGGDPDFSNCRPPGEHRSGAARMSNV